jgi:hypothetical protein
MVPFQVLGTIIAEKAAVIATAKIAPVKAD